jgi:hypothetical protein
MVVTVVDSLEVPADVLLLVSILHFGVEVGVEELVEVKELAMVLVKQAMELDSEPEVEEVDYLETIKNQFHILPLVEPTVQMAL